MNNPEGDHVGDDSYYQLLLSAEHTQGENWSPRPIFDLVGIQEDTLKPKVGQFFRELQANDEVSEAITKLSLAVDGYYQYQDILDLRWLCLKSPVCPKSRTSAQKVCWPGSSEFA